jgi:prepilin-type N-terminal cleavage/methylation domain-containing protein
VNRQSHMRRARAFTLIETMIVVSIIAILMAIFLIAIRKGVMSARISAERQLCASLVMACNHFDQQFGFLPPLIDDMAAPAGSGPVQNDPRSANGGKVPLVKHDDFLASDPASNPGIRYSDYSLAYYIVGACDRDVDGVDGPGFTEPKPDGTFSKRGKTYESMFDVTKDRGRMERDPADPSHMMVIHDRWWTPADPTPHRIRYYRWLPAFYDQNNAAPPGSQMGQVRLYNVPPELGDPTTNPELRQARFAVVSAGPDGIFGTPDDIVELGK